MASDDPLSTPHNPNAHSVGAVASAHAAVRIEEIRLLYLQANNGFIATIIVATVVGIPLLSALTRLQLGSWYGMVLLVTFLRYLLVRRYWATPSTGQGDAGWEKTFVIGAAFAGIVWGGLGILVVSNAEISYQAFVGFALGGMAAGAASSLGSRQIAFTSFMLPMLLPFATALVVTGGTFQTSMGILVLVFSGLLFTMSQRIYKTISQSLTLRFENDALLAEYARAKEFEENLNQELKAEIDERKAVEALLIKAKQEADMASRTKSSFLANMSHEIRTPLTAILGFTESIMDGRHSQEALVNDAGIILRNGRLLLEIINDILDLSKIEADKIEIEHIPFSPVQVIYDVEKSMGLNAREKGLQFNTHYHFPLPETIMGDPTRLKQILLNLSGNALKFTERGNIALEVKCEEETLKVTVIDSGIGISEKQQANLFSPFSQADSSTTRRFGGSGLGLYISRRLAQLLGGTVSVSSTLGVGSRFEVSVATGPLDGVGQITSNEQIARLTHTAQESIAIPLLRGHVLLAEDGLDNQRLIAALVEKSGARLTIVDDGEKAVERAMSENYDLLLMDMQMPKMGGLDATRLLRQAGYTRAIVAFTANVMKQEIQQYADAGCDGYLSKPIDRARFYAMLSRHLPSDQDAPAAQATDDFFASPEFHALSAQFAAGLVAVKAQIATAAAESDWQSLRGIAHTLKGTAASFGYPQLTETAALLESAIKQEHGADVALRLSALNAVLDNILPEGFETEKS